MKKTFLLLMLMTLTAVLSCDKWDKDSKIRLKKLDITDAKYLSIATNATKAANNEDTYLFKIDAEGNITAVVLTCIESSEGSDPIERTDIQIVPKAIIPLSGKYTLMLRCNFKQGETFISLNEYYEPEAFYFNILVNNEDGKIYYIPESASEKYGLNYFHTGEPVTHAIDRQGELYALFGDILIKITNDNSNLVFKEIGSNLPHGEIYPIDNGTILVGEGSIFKCLYPNGGFEELDSSDFTFLNKTSSGLIAIKAKRKRQTDESEYDYTITLHNYTVGASYGNNTISQPVASISSGTEYSTNLNDPSYLDWAAKLSGGGIQWITPIVETDDSYFLGQCLRVSKETWQITPLNWEQSNRIIFPTKDNIYKGLSWKVLSNQASWYNIKTLESGTIDFDFSEIGDFVKQSYYCDIPSGKLTIIGIRNYDGKQITITVNFETGEYQYKINETLQHPITVLIPMN